MKAIPALAAALFLLTACDPGPRTGTVVTSTPSTGASGFSPRSDGLYVGPPAGTNRMYLRFYDDHAVVEAGVALSATPDDVRRWLTKDQRQAGFARDLGR
jgi:hypothetical protein